MALRAREAESPEVALARQRSENDLADLRRTREERLSGLENVSLARHGPVRHVATAFVLPVGAAAETVLADLAEELDPEVRRRSEKAAEDIAVAYETARGPILAPSVLPQPDHAYIIRWHGGLILRKHAGRARLCCSPALRMPMHP